MPTHRIIAQFMHDTELVEARKLVPDGTVEGRLIIGDADDSAIQGLRDAGLFVQTVDPEPTGGIAGLVAPPVNVFNLGGDRVSPIQRDDLDGAVTPADEDVYVIGLLGPLLPAWSTDLQKASAHLLERVGDQTYTARISRDEVPSVSGMPFVSQVRLYRPSDTVDPSQLMAASAPGSGNATGTFEALTHRAEDLKAVTGFLAEHSATIVGTGQRKVRFIADRLAPMLVELARMPEVETVDEFVPPQLFNDHARVLLGVEPDTLGTSRVGLTGNLQVVAVADTGLDDKHPDFKIRAVIARGRPGDSSDPHGHGTHVAGSVLGNGTMIKGTACDAELFFQSILDAQGGLGGLPVDLADLFQEAYNAGARIHNNSWGAAAGSAYRISSREVDEYVAAHPDFLVVIAAGNEGSAAAPLNAPAGCVEPLSVGAPATAKNALTVGACRSDRHFGTQTFGQWWPGDFPTPPVSAEVISGDDESMAAFSSRGPCTDGQRIKPDVVAPGTFILSTRSKIAPTKHYWAENPSDPKYAYMGGTSMACPLVSGCAALVREYYVSANHNPSAALLKATLINGARWLTGADAVQGHGDAPNYQQGFGRVHLPHSIPSSADPSLRLEFVDTWEAANKFITSGQADQYLVKTDPGELDITLVWTDPPGRGLQNTLYLLVELPDRSKRFGNDHRLSPMVQLDTANNVQVVRLPAATAGTFTIQVSAGDLLLAPQAYALVVTGALQSALTPV
jgi:subtilisin family serine protease